MRKVVSGKAGSLVVTVALEAGTCSGNGTGISMGAEQENDARNTRNKNRAKIQRHVPPGREMPIITADSSPGGTRICGIE